MTMLTEAMTRDALPLSRVTPRSEPWTFDDDEIVRDAWIRGLSAEQTVPLLHLRTKGMVSQRRIKLGLVTERTRAKTQVAPVPRAFSEPRPLAQDTGDLPPLTEAGRPWEQRRLFQCAYPVSGEGATVHSCCKPIDKAYGYCKKHYSLMYYPAKTRY